MAGMGISLKWRRRFLDTAQLVAGWSKDPSSKVGAVIVRPDRTIAAVGFNGFPRGVVDGADRLGDRNEKLLFTLHAELNAILSAKEPLMGCYLFVWPLPPCCQCAGAIIQSGIQAVICPATEPERWKESITAGKKALFEAGVELHLV